MKVVFNKTELSSAVTTVQRAVAGKSTKPALEGILITAKGVTVSLCGYDMEIGITTEIPASIIEEGEIVLNARTFSEMVKKMPDEIITIETDEKLVTYIVSGEAAYQIVGISSYEYPELPIFDKLQSFDIKAETLKSMIKDTSYAIGDNPTKPTLMGAYFDIKDSELNVVAVDGFRMSVRKEPIECSETFDFIVPKKTVTEIARIECDDESIVTLTVGEKHIMCRIEGYCIISRLIEGTFIKYKDTIPKDNATEMKISTRSIISSLERMSLVTNDKMMQPVHLLVADNGMKIFCTTNLGKATDFIPLSFDGSEVEIGFNTHYMLDAVKNIGSDEVLFVFNGPNRPLKILPTKGDHFTALVVPMRI